MCALSVPWGEAARRAFALALPLLLIGCQTTGDQQSTGGAAVPIASLPTGSAVTPEDLFIVDCLLPGQARRLGTGVTYVAARRAIKAPAYDCARRGGEYVLPGQATQLSALDRWLPVARAGDAEAQAYVGEIHERGIDRAPNLAEAARWYALAADQGNTRAMVNLAALYESGTGVPQDRDRAVELYAEAAGLDVASFRQASAAAAEPVVIRSRTVVEVPVADPALERENARLAAELAAAQGALAAAETRIDDLGTRSAEATARARKLEGERAALTAQLDTAASTPNTGAETAALRVALAEKDAALRAERAESEALQRQMVAVQARAEAQVRDTEAALAAREASAATEDDAEVERLRDELASSRAALGAREAELAGLIAREEASAGEIERLRDERAGLAAELEAARAAGQDNPAEALTAELAKRDQALAERSTTIATLRAEIESVRASSAAELADARQTAARLLEKSEADRQALAGTLADAEAERTSLEASLAEARSALAGRETEIAFLTEERDALSARAAAGEASAEQAARIATLERRIADRERALAVSDARVKELDGKLAEIRAAASASRSAAGTPGQPASGAAVQGDIAQFLQETRVLFGNFHALVIGNTDYAHLPDLETPERDVKRIAAVLRERYGFQVRVLLNASRYEILSAINDYYRTLTENDNFLLYYAGHGEIDRVNERGHWLPVDAEPQNSANWLSVQSITDQLNGMSVRKAIVIADSCYSGILTRAAITRLRPGMSEASMRRFLITMSEKRSRMVLSSGGVRPVLDGGGGDHSVFARAFIDALEGNAQILEGFELYRRVAEAVTNAAARLNAEQTPEYAPMRFAGHESGDFFFIPRSPS